MPEPERERRLPKTLSQLRQKLSQKAKQQPKFRFYTLYDRIYRRDTLEAAWRQVQANGGAPGVDGVAIEQMAATGEGVEHFLDEIQEALRTKTYRPSAVRRYDVSTFPKPTESSDPWASRRSWHDALHSNGIVNTISVWIINHFSNTIKLLRSNLEPPRRIHHDLFSAEDSLTSELVNLVNRDAEFFGDRMG